MSSREGKLKGGQPKVQLWNANRMLVFFSFRLGPKHELSDSLFFLFVLQGIMPSAIVEFFRSRLHGEKPLHVVEKRAAKHYTLRRLAAIFPEISHDRKALEELYRTLTLEPRQGAGEGGEMLFELLLPPGLNLQRKEVTVHPPPRAEYLSSPKKHNQRQKPAP
jgi:hypothetical protein